MYSQGLKEDLEALLKLNNSLVAKLTELIERVEKHIRDCLIAKTTGVSVAAVGTSMVVGGWIAGLVLAVPTFGLSLTIPAVMTVAGTATAVAGKLELSSLIVLWLCQYRGFILLLGGLTTAGTEIANGIISKQFLDEVIAIQNNQATAAKKTEEKLRRIQCIFTEHKNEEDEINGHSTGERENCSKFQC